MPVLAKTLRMARPMDRRKSGAEDAPYELKNARVEPAGRVRALHAPAPLAGEAGVKPWVRWNGERLSRVDDAFEAAQPFNGHLYTTARRDDGRAATNKAFGPKHTQASPDVKATTAMISMVNAHDDEPVSTESHGISRGSSVQYVFIPVNDRQEAGPWSYFSYRPDGLGDTKVSPVIQMTCNEETSYVEVYRTREAENGDLDDASYYYAGRAERDGTVAKFHDTRTWIDGVRDEEEDEDAEDERDSPVIQLDRDINAHTSDVGSMVFSGLTGNYTVTYINPRSYGANCLLNHGNDRMIYGGVEWPTKMPQARLLERTGAEPAVYDVAFQYEYAVGGETVYGPVLYLNGASRAIVAYQGEAALLVYVKDAQSNYKLYRRLVADERGLYNDKTGVTGATEDVYGCVVEFTQMGIVQQKVHHGPQNQSQCLAATGNLGEWKVVSSKVSDKVSLFSFDASTYDVSELKATGLEAVTTTVYEPNVVMMSERYRPAELLVTAQFELADQTDVLAITAARQSEVEQNKTYSFYVFTRDNVYVCDRVGAEAVSEVVIPTVGLAEHVVSVFDAGRPGYSIPLVVQTKYGTVFHGTDSRMYYLSGRQFKTIDAEVPNIWYADAAAPQFDRSHRLTYYWLSQVPVWLDIATDYQEYDVAFPTLTVYDLAYDPTRDELFVATKNSIWVYAFDEGGWVAAYDAPNVLHVDYWKDLGGVVAFYENNSPTADEYKLLNESGDPLPDAALLTQPVFAGAEDVLVREVRSDYTPVVKAGRFSSTLGTDGGNPVTTLTRLPGDSDTFELPLGNVVGDRWAMVMGQSLAPGGKDLVSLVRSVASSQSANLDGHGVASADVHVRWFPLMEVQHEVESDHLYFFAEATGDDIDPVRRNERRYPVLPRRRAFPRVKGTGHVLKFTRFKEFRNASFVLETR